MTAAAMLSLMLLLPAPAPAPATSAPVQLAESQRIIDKPGEIVTRLENGMVVIVKQHRAAPVVAVRVYVKTGSIYEQEHLGCGLSHLFEHLLHGGTTTSRSERQARLILDRIGSRSNAYTTKDHTCYYIETASEFLPEAVNLLADFITRPAFDQSEFDREWGVVQRELEMHHDDPGRQLYYLVYENLYQVHPSRFPVIGYKSVVQSLTRQDVIAYYQRMYVPDNVIVSIVGDLEPDSALRMVCREFADFARRPVPNIVVPDEPTQATPRKLVKYMKVPDCRVSVAWPTIRLTHPDLYALDVLSDVLTKGRLSRLVRKIVIDEQLATSATSYSYTPHWGAGLFDIRFTCRPDKLDAVLAAIDQEIETVKTTPVSEEELQRVKRQTIADFVYSRQTAAELAASMATSYMATGDPHFDDAYVANIQRVSPQQVQEAAVKYLPDHRRNTSLILPEELREAVTPTSTGPVTEGIRYLELDNALRVLIKPNPTAELVAVQIYFNAGLLYESVRDNGISNLTAAAARYGTKNRSFEQIAQLAESRGIQLNSGSGRNTLYFTCQCLSDDLDQALALLADVVANPTFDEKYVAMLKQRTAAAIRRIDDHWYGELTDFFHQAFFSNSPYHMRPMGTLAAVEKLTPDRLKAFHAERTRGPEAVVGVFGKLDADHAAELVAKHFGALPAKPGPPRPAYEPEPPIDQPVVYLARSRHTQTAGVMIGYRGVRLTDVDDRYALTVLETIVGGYHYPGGWLHEALRGTDPQTGQTRDLVYAVHFVNRPWPLPGYLAAIAGCQPQKVNQVVKIILDKLDLASQGQIDEDEFETAKDLVIAADALDKQTNAELAAQACLDELYGLGYDFHQRQSARIQAVSLDQVKDVARKYLTNPIICISIAQPDLVDLPFETRSWSETGQTEPSNANSGGASSND